jgi:hypothetical protein
MNWILVKEKKPKQVQYIWMYPNIRGMIFKDFKRPYIYSKLPEGFHPDVMFWKPYNQEQNFDYVDPPGVDLFIELLKREGVKL